MGGMKEMEVFTGDQSIFMINSLRRRAYGYPFNTNIVFFFARTENMNMSISLLQRPWVVSEILANYHKERSLIGITLLVLRRTGQYRTKTVTQTRNFGISELSYLRLHFIVQSTCTLGINWEANNNFGKQLTCT